MTRPTGTTIRTHPEIDSGINEELVNYGYTVQAHRGRNDIISFIIACFIHDVVKSGLTLAKYLTERQCEVAASIDVNNDEFYAQMEAYAEKSEHVSLMDLQRTFGRVRKSVSSIGMTQYRFRQLGRNHKRA